MTQAATERPTGLAQPPAPERANGLPHQPALDGLRCLAVVAVLVFHQGFGWASGGFLGVDAFFVLSGYLITTLLVIERSRTGGIGLWAFWGRRARRLLPAMFVLLAIVALYAAFFAEGTELLRIRSDALATLLYVQNWHLIFANQSYFDQFLLPSPLQHTWSLAIEEQWYLIWPLLLGFVLWRVKGRLGRALPVIAILAVGSAVLMAALFHPGTDPSRIYYGTDTRAQALLIGAGLGVLLQWRGGPTRAWARHALECAGLVGLVVFLWLATHAAGTDSWLYRGGATLAAVSVVFVIAAAIQPTSPVLRRAFSLGPLCAIGLISYGVYLFHWPVYIMLTPDRIGLHGWALFALRVSVTLVIATVSYFLVEMPVRRGVLHRGAARIALPAAAAVVCVAVLASTTGLIGREPETIDVQAGVTDEDVYDNFIGRAMFAPVRRLAETPPGITRVLIAGDSVAFTLASNKPGLYEGNGIRAKTASILGCGIARGDRIVGGEAQPFLPQCNRWPPLYRGMTEAFKPQVSVLMLGAWEVFDRNVDGHTLRVGSPELAEYLRSELDLAVERLTAGGAPLILLTTPCFDEPETSLPGMSAGRNDDSRVAWLNRVWRSYADDHEDTVQMVDLGKVVCPGGEARQKVNGKDFRYDGVHFTDAGANFVWDWLAPIAIATAEEHARPTAPNQATPTK